MKSHEGWQDIISLPQLDPDSLYFLSTQNTSDRGWETMVFLSGEDHVVVSYCDLAQAHHLNSENALAYHNRILRTRFIPQQDLSSS